MSNLVTDILAPKTTLKLKVGLYFGTFNPIHIGHLAIANYISEFTDIDQLWCGGFNVVRKIGADWYPE